MREEEGNEYDQLSHAAAMANLRAIRSTLRASGARSEETRAHRARLLFLIERALDPRAGGDSPSAAPPG